MRHVTSLEHDVSEGRCEIRCYLSVHTALVTFLFFHITSLALITYSVRVSEKSVMIGLGLHECLCGEVSVVPRRHACVKEGAAPLATRSLIEDWHLDFNLFLWLRTESSSV